MSTERKEFESWVARVRLPYCDTPADRAQQWIGWQGGRASPAAAVPEGALPPLPKSHHKAGDFDSYADVYEPHEVQHIVRAAVEADRASQEKLLREKDGIIKAHQVVLAEREAEIAALRADRAQQGEPVGYIYGDEFYFAGCLSLNDHIRASGEPVYRATKAAAPADARIETLARKLAEFYPDTLPNMFCDGQPVGRKLVEACRAAPVPDTGIPTAGEVTFDAWFEEWRRSTWKPLPSDIANGRAACPEHWNTNPRRHMEIAWSAARRAPVSGTPTSGAVEKAGEIARLKDQRDRLLAFIQNADVSSGVCCCGDSMERHGNPMDCGHNPVDMWDHSVICWAEEIEKSDRAAPSLPSEAKAGEMGNV